eukprot:1161615-Pelagomonas_calceolata.AAC.4
MVTQITTLAMNISARMAEMLLRTTKDNVVNAVHIITQRASSIGGRPIESNGTLLCVDCPCADLLLKSNLKNRPEGVADFLVSKLTGWVVSFYIGSGDWGSGLYGMVEPLPAIVIEARDISRA